MKNTALALLALLVPCVAQEPVEAEPPDVWDAITGGDTWLVFRYRYEYVDQDGIGKKAHASTLRTVLGYETQPYHSWRGLLEFEDVRAIGDDAYNSTTNGNTDRPVVLDPEGTEVNRAFLAYGRDNGFDGKLGRQNILLDNERFFGNVAWRQNYQTFDALSIFHPLGEHSEIYAAFIDNVNRVTGEASATPDAGMNSGVLNANTQLGSVGKLAGYWYYLDYSATMFAGLSTSTVGARLTGKQDVSDGLAATYGAEYAHQTDVADNPFDISEGYYHLNLGAIVSGVGVELGYEVLEGSGNPGQVFTAPLGTQHKFNGWADKFLTPTIPTTGLKDAYVSVGGKIERVTTKAIYHDFTSQTGGLDYGTELDLLATIPIGERSVFGLKYANYMADSFATDTVKFWAWISLSI